MACFCDYLKQRLPGDLPGATAQKKMAPFNGKKRPSKPPEGAKYRDSAVLILLTRPIFDENGYRVLLTLRSKDMPTHKGQISLPGGNIKPGESEVETAIREANEEVGINEEDIWIIGRLTNLFIPNSTNYVHPVLACADKIPSLKPNSREVDEAFFVSLDDLGSPDKLHTGNWEIRNRTFRVPFWDIHKRTPLWGATAMILSELIELYRHFKNTVLTDRDR